MNIWNWCRTKDIFIMATYLPGLDNGMADLLSRVMAPHEWRIWPDILEWVFNELRHSKIDRFATAENTQLPLFCSRVHQEAAIATDCLSISWSNDLMYAYPPLPVISEVLRKVRRDRASLISSLLLAQEVLVLGFYN
ncbi:UNVERIFIED_CONTAM: hypothetical protein FKN15_055981 [Acipenser sinensis]